VFRPSEDALEVVKEALKLRPKLIWLQLGIVNEQARKLAESEGIIFVQNKCIKVEYDRLIG